MLDWTSCLKTPDQMLELSVLRTLYAIRFRKSRRHKVADGRRCSVPPERTRLLLRESRPIFSSFREGQHAMVRDHGSQLVICGGPPQTYCPQPEIQTYVLESTQVSAITDGNSQAKAILFGVISKPVLQSITVWLYHREHFRVAHSQIQPLVPIQLPAEFDSGKMTFLADMYLVAYRKNMNELAASALEAVKRLRISVTTMDNDMGDDDDEAGTATYLARSTCDFTQAMKIVMYNMQGNIRKELRNALLDVYVPTIVDLCMAESCEDCNNADTPTNHYPSVVEELMTSLEQWCHDDGDFAKDLLRCIVEEISKRYSACAGGSLDDID